jgi:hypothetical protein
MDRWDLFTGALTNELQVIFTWKYRQTRLPLMLVILSLAITAALYGTISIPFAIHVALRAYIAWYFIVFFEVGTNILIAMKWRAVSFENTHLVERMSCLTLIVVSCHSMYNKMAL